MAASSEDLSRDIARLVDEKLGEDIVCLNMRELVTYTDYLVICTARNERQAEAIAEQVHLRLKHDRSLLPVNPDRSGDAGWTVLDYLVCVLLIFTVEARESFDLEDLWHEAPRVEFELDQPSGKSASAV